METQKIELQQIRSQINERANRLKATAPNDQRRLRSLDRIVQQYIQSVYEYEIHTGQRCLRELSALVGSLPPYWERCEARED